MRTITFTVLLLAFSFTTHNVLAAPQASPAPIKLTDADNNKSVEVIVGQRIEIRLQANPTTGYEWLLHAFSGGLELEEFSYTRTGKQMAGSGGLQTVNFFAKSSGNADVKLEYRRPWEHNTAPAKTFTLKVTVR